MFSSHLVNGTDLDQWAERRDAQGMLPRLIRNLIYATVQSLERIGFPADDAILLGGYDGIVVTASGNEYVPAGISVWELGTNDGVKGKADDDYKKRTAVPGDVIPAQAVFVFVTPRRWGGKVKWIAARKKEGIWKDVRAYDADDLVQWLERAEAVHRWLSSLLGKRYEGATDFIRYWATWASITFPPLSVPLLTAGRDDATSKVHGWLQGPSAALGLKADSQEEAIAYFAATIELLAPEEKLAILTRCLVIDNAASWHAVIATRNPLILISTFDSSEAVGTAVDNGHHVLVPMGKGAGFSPATVEVPLLRYEQAAEALIAMGISDDKVSGLAALARRSMTSLRRKLAINPGVRVPRWSAPTEACSLLPIALVGTWQDNITNDRKAIEKIAGQPYEEISRLVVRWENTPDAPVRRTGSVWMVSSKEDSWRLLAGFITHDLLSRFEATTIAVLSELDSTYDLPPNERWLGSMQGKGLIHSGIIREGLADTLALMATLSDVVPFAGGGSGQDIATRVVQRVLESGQTNWRLWASLSRILPLLAEAAPDAFLEAVEQSLTNDANQFTLLLSDAQKGQFGDFPQTGLLWALENLAWHSDYVSRSTLALARLAKADPNPDSKATNRPHSSLRTIHLSWLPQTSADGKQRLRVLDTVIRREPVVAWQLMLGILPNRHSVTMESHKPTWRDWVPNSVAHIQGAELWNITDEIVTRLLAQAGCAGSRWADLVSVFNRVYQDQYERILTQMSSLDPAQFGDADQMEVATALRKQISKHRSYRDAEWSLPDDVIDRLEVIHARFEPTDPVEMYSWLFAGSPSLTKVSMQDREEWERQLREAQQNAIAEVYSAHGLVGILALARQAERAGEIGALLANYPPAQSDEDAVLMQGLSQENNALYSFVYGFIVARTEKFGTAWGAEKLRAAVNNWTAIQKAFFLLALPFGQPTWDLLEEVEEEAKSCYWKRIRPWRIENAADCLFIVSNLLEYGRGQTALTILSRQYETEARSVPIETVADIVEQTCHMPVEEAADWSYLPYALVPLLEAMEAGGIAKERLASIEWMYLPLLENERPPTVLTRELASNPDFFIEVLCLVFKARGEEPRVGTAEDANRAQLAYTLLQAWQIIPGTQDDGTINPEALNTWITSARAAAATNGREETGDITIGHVLAFAPKGEDDQWPHETIRGLIEDLSSLDLEGGIETQVYNNRGVTSRAAYAGGDQERALASIYQQYATAVADTWPRTAAMLRRLAQTYSDEATREDTRTSLREDLGL